MRRVWLWWSSGKDSAWSLQVLRGAPDLRVTGLVTTVTEDSRRVAVHGTPTALLRAQAGAARLALHEIPLPEPCSNERYEAAVGRIASRARAEGVEVMAFGDLFLADIRDYRERLFASLELEVCFPLWGCDTAALAREMVDGGLKARLVGIDPGVLPASFAGRAFDHDLLARLPEGVDPCGENGEFHTFAHAGPMFARDIPVDLGVATRARGLLLSELRMRGPLKEKSG